MVSSRYGCDDDAEEEAFMPMELAMQQELEYRRRRQMETSSVESLLHFRLPQHPISDSDAASVLKERDLLRSQLREASRKMAVEMDCLKDFMPMDLAMQREIAFQKKRRGETPTHSSSSSAYPSSFGLPTSNSGTKRKAMLGDIACSPAGPEQHSCTSQLPPSNQQNVSLFCNLCHVSCQGMFQLQQHCEGKQHRARQANLKNGRTQDNNMLWCDVCQVPCCGINSLEMHKAGKKHAAQLQIMESLKKTGTIKNQTGILNIKQPSSQ